MAEYSRFFNDVNGDREYHASDFAEYFSTFLSDGIFPENGDLGLKVTKYTGMRVKVETGYAFIKGYMYKNTAPLYFTLSNSDTLMDRIDRIVLRFDENNREIKVVVKTGTPSSSPQPPTLTRTSSIYELSLAQARVNKNSAIVTSVIDERYSDYCGVVSSLITIPIQDMWDQWNEWFQNRQNEIGVRVVNGRVEPEGLVAGDLWLREVD